MLPQDGQQYELLGGVLHDMSPGGGRHGAVVMRISVPVAEYAQKHDLGIVFDSQTGYRLDEKNCVSPDVSFVRRDRIARLLPDPDKFLKGAPDLAVEVLSPSDDWKMAERKVELYFRFGTRLVWIVDPRAKEARVYRTPKQFESSTLQLSGEDVLPGLVVHLADLFRELPFK